MHITYRNVNQAFKGLVSGFADNSIPTTYQDSRNGPVKVIEEPVILTLTHPRERVLFNQARDCNPFFHLYEAFWMLAGRNDVKAPSFYNSKFGQYSDDGRTFNGAYGYRWRQSDTCDWSTHQADWLDGETRVDQLDILVNHLRANPNSRRAVLQMWNVKDDLLKIDVKIQQEVKCVDCHGTGVQPGTESIYCQHCSGTGVKTREKILEPASKDVCCNTNIYFRIREEHRSLEYSDKYLDMTVCNRSNDLIWGLLGANIVHMSFLQEYMAVRLGVEIGHYHTMTNNLHVYTDSNSGWIPEVWLEEYNPSMRTMFSPPVDYTAGITPGPALSVTPTESIDQEIRQAVSMTDGSKQPSIVPQYKSLFIDHTFNPMMLAFWYHKQRNYPKAVETVRTVQSSDWCEAGLRWIMKRRINWEKKNND